MAIGKERVVNRLKNIDHLYEQQPNQ